MVYVVKNVEEERIFEKILDIIKDLDCCTCEKCINDIAAYALNQIKPKYVSTEIGRLYEKTRMFDKEHEKNLLVAILNAAEVVKNNPRH